MESGKEVPSYNEETSANPISRLTFSFFTSSVLKGFRGPLQPDDLYHLDSRDKTQKVVDDFEREWMAQKKLEKPSVSKAVVKAFGPYFASSWFAQAIAVGCALGQTQVLNYLVLFLALPFWYNRQNGLDGYMLALGIALLAALRSVCVYQSQMISQRTAARIRNALTAAVYRKSMNISVASRNAASNGQIVNLISNDTQRLVEVFMFFNEGVFALPQIIVCLALLWQQLGPHALTGFACMLMTVPLTGMATRHMTEARRQMLENTDRRVKVTSEVLIAIKVVKFYVWERSFLRDVDEVRKREMSCLFRFLMWRMLMITMIAVSPVVMSLVSFVTFTAIPGNVLYPNIVFTSLSLFNLLRLPLTMVPMLIGVLVQLSVSMDRFGKFLQEEDCKTDMHETAAAKKPRESDGALPSIVADDLEFRWAPEVKPETLAMSNLTFSAYPGEVIMVVGSVGSGKSALVQGLIGDTLRTKGDRFIRGRIAYVPQQAWIMNATLRENILFGQPYDEAKYELVCKASALVGDFAMLPGGDLTEIGERGINLSGGQRQRVSIARAAYSDSDVVIMDDPLSAVDAHVAQHLFFECFRGLMKEKCILLCTNQLQFLPHATSIIMVANRSVTEMGTYEQLRADKGAFAQLIEEHSSGGAAEEQDQAEKKKKMEEGGGSAKAGALVLEETKESGLVPASCYVKYFRAGNFLLFATVILTFACENTALALSIWWLASWSTYVTTNFADAIANQNALLGIYAGLSGITIVFTILRNTAFAMFNVKASRSLHVRLLGAVLRFPQAFFDTTPLGRILNRFTKDMDTIDSAMPQSMQFMLVTLFMVVSTVVIVAVIQPVMTAVVVPLAVFFYLLSRFSRYTSVELQRLESVARSPIYAQLSETLGGVSTIRAFGQGDRLQRLFVDRCDVNQRAFLMLQISNQWLGIRLDMLGYILLYLAATIMVIYRGQTSPGLGGFVLTQVLQIMNFLNRLATQIADVETKMNSVERIEEFCDAPQEPPEEIASTHPGTDWPQKGGITFENVSMRYRPGLPLVVQDVSINFKPGEKVGVVGRTGAGKSSVMLLLFRICEVVPGGRILIDGVDISRLGLSTLRSKLAIIPQEPFLFSGTVRANLDPFEEFDDERIWKTLRQVRLEDEIKKKEKGLLEEVQEGGENFSVGQRQLICLGRALLRDAKVLLMDEATASVDVETDQHIQNTVWTEFAHCTVITIAHRLNTIMNYDRILVLDQGKVAEFDTPQQLLLKGDGVFGGLVDSTGRTNAEYLRKMSSTGARTLHKSLSVSEVLVAEKADD